MSFITSFPLSVVEARLDGVRLGLVHLDAPKALGSGPARYRAQLLIDRSSEACLVALVARCAEAWSKATQEDLRPEILPLVDGSMILDRSKKPIRACAGAVVLASSAVGCPTLIADGQAGADPKRFFQGSKVDAIVRLSAAVGPHIKKPGVYAEIRALRLAS